MLTDLSLVVLKRYTIFFMLICLWGKFVHAQPSWFFPADSLLSALNVKQIRCFQQKSKSHAPILIYSGSPNARTSPAFRSTQIPLSVDSIQTGDTLYIRHTYLHDSTVISVQDVSVHPEPNWIVYRKKGVPVAMDSILPKTNSVRHVYRLNLTNGQTALDFHDSCTFGKSGLLLNCTRFTSNHVQIQKIIYQYTPEGRIREIQTASEQGTVTERFSYLSNGLPEQYTRLKIHQGEAQQELQIQYSYTYF